MEIINPGRTSSRKYTKIDVDYEEVAQIVNIRVVSRAEKILGDALLAKLSIDGVITNG